MNDTGTDWATPARTYHGTLSDSTKWEQFSPRTDDIVVSTPAKSGTTWTQAILSLLISGDPDVDANPSFNAPWYDAAFSDTDDLLARLNGQQHRRHVKTHTPLDAVPIWPDVKYITVYRHPIDVHFSARKHVFNYAPDIARERNISDQNFPQDPRESFRIFLTSTENEDHGTLRVIVDHYLASLKAEQSGQVLRLHYADMTRDLDGAVNQIARHIGITHEPELMKSLTDAARFDSMKKNADRFALAQGKGVWRDDKGFFDSATSNKWEGVLTEDDLANYQDVISSLLTPDQRQWLEWGTV